MSTSRAAVAAAATGDPDAPEIAPAYSFVASLECLDGIMHCDVDGGEIEEP